MLSPRPLGKNCWCHGGPGRGTYRKQTELKSLYPYKERENTSIRLDTSKNKKKEMFRSFLKHTRGSWRALGFCRAGSRSARRRRRASSCGRGGLCSLSSPSGRTCHHSSSLIRSHHGACDSCTCTVQAPRHRHTFFFFKHRHVILFWT